MFTPTLRCECAQPASDRLMRKWCIVNCPRNSKIALKLLKLIFPFPLGIFLKMNLQENPQRKRENQLATPRSAQVFIPASVTSNSSLVI